MVWYVSVSLVLLHVKVWVAVCFLVVRILLAGNRINNHILIDLVQNLTHLLDRRFGPTKLVHIVVAGVGLCGCRSSHRRCSCVSSGIFVSKVRSPRTDAPLESPAPN